MRPSLSCREDGICGHSRWQLFHIRHLYTLSDEDIVLPLLKVAVSWVDALENPSNTMKTQLK